MSHGIFLRFALMHSLVCALHGVMGQGEFMDVLSSNNAIARGPVYYVFDGNSPARSICPTIIQSDVDGSDIVLQPNSPTADGNFSYRDADMQLFNMMHCRCPCFQDEQATMTCDQLIIIPLRIPTDKGRFDVRYTPGTAPRIPINITVEYGPAGIVYDGDVPNGYVVVGPDADLEYQLRVMTRDSSAGITVCENLSGGVQSSKRLIARGPMVNNIDCIPASEGGGFRGIFSVRVTYSSEEDMNFGNSSVFLTHASKNNPEEAICTEGDGILTSSLLNVIYSNTTEPPESPVTTTMISTSDFTTTDDDGGSGGGGLGIPYIIIIAVVCIGVAVVAVIVSIVIVVNCRRSTFGQDQTADVLHDPDKISTLNNDTTTEKKKSNFYIELEVTVSSVAFMTAEHTPKYQELMAVILKEHGGDCKKVSLINTLDPTRDDYVNSISRCLKTEEECLVYIIWNGSLESIDQNGICGPPIKDVIRFFSLSPLRKQSQSVMHKLILLQLGSKGNVDSNVSPQESIKVYWDISGTDNAFDPRTCAENMVSTVMVKLNEHKASRRRKKSDDELLKVSGTSIVLQNELRVKSNPSRNISRHNPPADSQSPPPSYQSPNNQPCNNGGNDSTDLPSLIKKYISTEVVDVLKETIKEVGKESRKEIIQTVNEVGQKVDYGNERQDTLILGEHEVIEMNNMDSGAQGDENDGTITDDETEGRYNNNKDKKRKTTML